jgi:cell division transport system permease protein
MAMRIRVGYFAKEALSSFRKNWVMSTAAVSTIMLTLLILGAFVVLVLNLNILIKGFESKVEVTVFLKETAAPGDVQNLQIEVVSWPEVSDVMYVSKEQALERLKQDLRDQPEMLEALAGNPLPASLEIKLETPRAVDSVASRLKGKEPVDEIKYGREVVKKLFAFTAVLRWISVIVVSLLSFASLVLISNTIRLAIFARRKEITIMRLVGATNWFIRWPFLFEGILQGFIGAVLAVIALYFANALFVERVGELIRFLPFSFSRLIFIELMVGLALAGVFIGAAGSSIALRKFLRV